MKKHISFIVIILISSCKPLPFSEMVSYVDSYPEIKIYNYSKHVTNNDTIEFLEEINPNKEFNSGWLSICEIIINKKTGVGLYSFRVSGHKSCFVTYKVLKSDSQVLISSDKKTNEIIYNKFEKKYSSIFSKRKLQKIKASFFEGTEYSAHFL
jgi:hypothetical protein